MKKEKKKDGSITIFLALSLVLILSLILGCLEVAFYSVSDEYAEVLLKTATESVLAEYYGPLFSDYQIFAIDTGFGNKTADRDELVTRLKGYMGENVWDFSPDEVRLTGTKQIFEEDGMVFLEQAAEYEKYAAVSGIADEILDRVKALGDQKKITKVLEKRLDIEDELAVIDGYTLDLMRLIDGVNINPKLKKASLKVYDIETYFIKRFCIHDVNPTMCAINNPSVFSKLEGWYEDPIDEVLALRQALPGYAEVLGKRMECEEKIKSLEETLANVILKCREAEGALHEEEVLLTGLQSELEAVKEKLEEALESEEEGDEAGKSDEDGTNAMAALENNGAKEEDTEALINNYKRSAAEYETDIAACNERIGKLEAEISGYYEEEQEINEKLDPLRKQLEEILISENRQRTRCESKASALYNLCSNVSSELNEVISIIDSVAEKQEKVRPLVEGYEDLVDTVAPIISDEIKNGLEDSLDLMKAYVGLENNKIKVIDFEGILETAEYDAGLMREIDLTAFVLPQNRDYDTIMAMLGPLEGMEDRFRRFRYEHFVFDYSGIKENVIEDNIAAEFEENVSEGYMSLFLDDTSIISDGRLISELLPSLWYEVAGEQGTDADSLTKGAEDKSGGDLLEGTDEGSGIGEICDLLEQGLDVMGTKVLSAMYMMDHFKNFREYSAVGDTVLDYETEYILSGYETDAANLSAAATKILLLRMLVSTIYTMTDGDAKAQAEAVAMAAMGFTGMPFLVTIVKYLILFLWATAQAVIETAAILKGKKVPVITSSESFCLTLPELAVFPSLIKSKSDNFKESELYLDYGNYLFVLLLIQGKQKQAARAMDLIQENIRYRYNDDFLMNNAIVGFCAEADFDVAPRYISVFPGLSGKEKTSSGYSVTVSDVVCYK